MANISKKTTGDWGEKVAAWYLAKKGYQVIAQHYTSRFGEIDLIVRDGQMTVFVEVKTRLGGQYGLPEEAITRRKFIHLRKVVLAYISRNNIENFRIDALAIERDFRRGTVNIRHHQSISDILWQGPV